MKTKETSKTPITKFPIRTTFCGISSLTLLVISTSATSSLAQGENSVTAPLQHYDPGAATRGASTQFNPGVAGVARRPLRINPNFPGVLSTAASIPKGAIHLMLRSEAEARQIFTYFPYPWVAAQPGAVGVYRVEVNSQGTVAAVTILKSMGPRRDARVMKTFVDWRAKPGPLRIVDISWQMG